METTIAMFAGIIVGAWYVTSQENQTFLYH